MATYSKIASTTIGVGGAANIDFTNIPQNYDDLVVKFSLRSNLNSIFGESPIVNFNGSTAALYNSRRINAESNLGLGGQTYTAGTYLRLYNAPGNTSGANVFSTHELFIYGYKSANNKFATCMSGWADTANGYCDLTNGAWSSSAAINQITIKSLTASLLLQYSTATLYGIRRA